MPSGHTTQNLKIRGVLNNIFSRHSSFGDRSWAAFMALIMLLYIVMALGLGVILIDSVSTGSLKSTTSRIEAKRARPARTAIHPVGKIMVPQHLPQSYKLHFKIDGEKVALTTTKQFFDNIDVGDKIKVDYKIGILGGVLHQSIRIRPN